MKTHLSGAGNGLKLLVLVPHPDTRLLLRSYSASLFAAGFPGAWSFPWVAPLAILSRPFTAETLKCCAYTLREQSLADGKDGKIAGGPLTYAVFPFGGRDINEKKDDFSGSAIFGLSLDLVVSGSIFPPQAAAMIRHRFPQPVLGLAFTGDQVLKHIPSPPALSFRAAALANMSIRPLLPENGCSFEWKIGALRWLPPVRKKR